MIATQPDESIDFDNHDEQIEASAPITENSHAISYP
jgi:hypothetical protein